MKRSFSRILLKSLVISSKTRDTTAFKRTRSMTGPGNTVSRSSNPTWKIILHPRDACFGPTVRTSKTSLFWVLSRIPKIKNAELIFASNCLRHPLREQRPRKSLGVDPDSQLAGLCSGDLNVGGFASDVEPPA